MAKGKDVLTRLRNTIYLGSHPEWTGQEKHVDITFFVQGVQVGRGEMTLMSRWWSEVSQLRAEDRDEIQHRITASRILVMGVFALALPKTRARSFLTVADARGEWIFSVPNLSSIELSSGIRPLQSRVTQVATTAPSIPVVPVQSLPSAEQGDVDAAARLQRLQQLLDAGLLQQEEFDSKRKEIIESL